MGTFEEKFEKLVLKQLIDRYIEECEKEKRADPLNFRDEWEKRSSDEIKEEVVNEFMEYQNGNIEALKSRYYKNMVENLIKMWCFSYQFEREEHDEISREELDEYAEKCNIDQSFPSDEYNEEHKQAIKEILMESPVFNDFRDEFNFSDLASIFGVDEDFMKSALKNYKKEILEQVKGEIEKRGWILKGGSGGGAHDTFGYVKDNGTMDSLGLDVNFNKGEGHIKIDFELDEENNSEAKVIGHDYDPKSKNVESLEDVKEVLDAYENCDLYKVLGS